MKNMSELKNSNGGKEQCPGWPQSPFAVILQLTVKFSFVLRDKFFQIFSSTLKAEYHKTAHDGYF
jgi:hypothetical protein